VPCIQTDRGGDITFHGPGQLVGYPILKLDTRERDVHRYMRNLEEVVIRAVYEYGIDAGREERWTGVWTPAGKICAMGVHLSRWITRHGFALNVNTDLSYYRWIVPCGIPERPVASMQSILGHPVDFDAVAASLGEHFGQVFSRRMEPLSPQQLRKVAATP
jgi:lipoyl(octanoyl) transferase